MKEASLFNFNFTGELHLKYKSENINAMEANFNISLAEDKSKIDLITLFDNKELDKLKKYFSEIKNNDIRYGFTLKPEILKIYELDFNEAVTFEDFMSVGDYACLDLENYNYSFPV